METNKKPKVSVLMITYNHEKYIEDAIRGVFQQIEVDFELIISDDCSTDRTVTLIQNLLEREEGDSRASFFKQNPNIGMIQNFLFALSKCTGEYIAFCEGDDFWTDNRKLKKQVDLLDSNPSFVASFHQVKVRDERNQVSEINYFDGWDYPKIVPANFIIERGGGSFPSCSLVFRNLFHFPKTLFLNSASADRPLSLMLLLFGDFYFQEDVMGVYRLHSNGVMTGMLADSKRLLALHRKNYELLNQYLRICKPEHRKFVRNAISRQVKNILLIDKLNSLDNFTLVFKLNWIDFTYLTKRQIKKTVRLN